MWEKTTEEKYDEMLCVLPPEIQVSNGFLVGEATDHNENGVPRFMAFKNENGLFYAYSKPVTIKEFKEMMKRPI